MDRKSLSNLSIIKNLTKFKRQYLRKNQYGLLLHSANQSKVFNVPMYNVYVPVNSKTLECIKTFNTNC